MDNFVQRIADMQYNLQLQLETLSPVWKNQKILGPDKQLPTFNTKYQCHPHR